MECKIHQTEQGTVEDLIRALHGDTLRITRSPVLLSQAFVAKASKAATAITASPASASGPSAHRHDTTARQNSKMHQDSSLLAT